MADASRLHFFKITAVFIISIGFYCIFTRFSQADEGRIKVYIGNPHYWEYEGKLVLLLGGSNDF